jgi:hypothetical protein
MYPSGTNMAVDYLSSENNLKSKTKNPRSVVTLEGGYDSVYLALFGALMLDLRAHLNFKVDLIWIHSVSNAIGIGRNQSIYRSQIISWLSFRQWFRAYQKFTDEVAYCSFRWLSPIDEIFIFLRSRIIYSQMLRIKNISTYSIDGILVGDLIIDTYLRFRPSPSFNIYDSFVLKLIRQTLRDLCKANTYFSHAKPSVFICSNATYIQHGVPVRVAIKKGVPVRCFSNALNFGKVLTAEDFYHTSSGDNYRDYFADLSNNDLRLQEAERTLINRFNGGIDAATGYMRSSAYLDTEGVVPDVRGRVIIFLHDFYDSPHVYKDFIFVDFWSWIIETIDILQKYGVPFAIKPHPNQRPESDDAFRFLIQKYPKLLVLSSKSSNFALAKTGIVCGVTAYGTVAHELAYLGVPSIACAKNPHHEYDFCSTAKSLDEYSNLLRLAGESSISRDQMKLQALEFFYMQNLRVSVEERLFRDGVVTYFRSFLSGTFNSTSAAALQQIRVSSSWKRLIHSMQAYLPDAR